MKRFNKYIYILSTIFISIAIIMFLINSKTNLMVEIEYKSEDNAKIQLFYDNLKKGNPFDEENSIVKDIKDTESKFDKVKVEIPYEKINKIRIDIDGLKGPIRIKKICISMLGINIKEFSFRDIQEKFKFINDVEIISGEKYITLKSVGDDSSIGNHSVSVHSRSGKAIRLLLCSFIAIIAMVLIRIFNITYIKTEVEIKKERLSIGIFSFIIIISNLIFRIMPGELEAVSENRMLKEDTGMAFNEMKRYPKVYEEYYNDKLLFKHNIVKVNRLLKYKFPKNSPEKYVIRGNNDWLFYNSKYKEDTDTIADYQGTNLYTLKELDNIKHNLLSIKRTLNEWGTELFVFVAPNKSQIYSEFMPNKYIKNTGESRVEQSINYIRDNTDINIIYTKDELIKAKNNYDVYYKLDSHWNELGAYVGFTELMKNINEDEDIKELKDVKISKNEITYGDLSEMINLNGELNDNSYTVDDFKLDVEVENVQSDGSDFLRYKSSNMNGKKILAFRDSFFTSMIPYLSKEFEESLFIWDDFNKDMVKKEKPDIVIIESVERLTDDWK